MNKIPTRNIFSNKNVSKLQSFIFLNYFIIFQRPTNPLEYLGKYLLKKANEPPSPDESKSSTPVPME